MLHGMPLVILNMGGEMLYILEQRLQAQKIAQEKSVRVLQDVIGTMFSKKFVTEVFKPQVMYSDAAIRQVFDKLAHSSIMRLNSSSMSKLYDLMSMGVKYQVLTAAEPLEVAQLTLNHLDALKSLIKAQSAIDLVDNAIQNLDKMMQSFSAYDHVCLRYALCKLYQDRRVKVSLFLQEGIQFADGTIVIKHTGTLPNGAEQPGTIRYFGSDGKVIHEDKAADLKNSAGTEPFKTPAFSMSSINDNRHCKLGRNLYAMENRTKGATVAERGANSIPLQQGSGTNYEAKTEEKEAAKKALNSLAAMIGGSTAGTGKKDNFDMVELFPDTAPIGGSAGSEASAEIITFDVADQQNKSALEKLVGDFAACSTGGGDDDDDDDLLSLMDS